MRRLVAFALLATVLTTAACIRALTSNDARPPGCEAGACADAGDAGCQGASCGDASCKGAACLDASTCPEGGCDPPRANGVACSSPDQCISGFCVDGVCCDGACSASCGACNESGLEGQCAPIDQGTIGAPSCAGYLCDGAAISCPTSCDGVAACEPGYDCVGGECVIPESDCPLPWGGAIADDQTVTAYEARWVACDASCVSETRSCSDGTLSGSFGFSSCTLCGLDGDPCTDDEGCASGLCVQVADGKVCLSEGASATIANNCGDSCAYFVGDAKVEGGALYTRSSGSNCGNQEWDSGWVAGYAASAGGADIEARVAGVHLCTFIGSW